MNNTQVMRPLITFALFAYNQEKFVGEAIDGALSQTYSPLEIILSDDSSSDRTFEIMRELTAGYSGPHTVRLNRTPKNLGIGGHVNAVARLANGELLVFAAGDDISLPGRTHLVAQRWEESGRKLGVVSGYKLIDSAGAMLGRTPQWWTIEAREAKTTPVLKQALELIQANKFVGSGATAAWSSKCWSVFGPLVSTVVSEDAVLAFRAHLNGGLVFEPEELVLYRTHDANVWSRQTPGILTTASEFEGAEKVQSARWHDKAIQLENHLLDLERAVRCSMLREAQAVALRNAIISERHRITVRADWWSMTAWCKLKSLGSGLVKPRCRSELLWKIPRLGTLSSYATVRSLVSCALRRLRRSHVAQ